MGAGQEFLTTSLMSSLASLILFLLARHLHAAAHLLCLPALLAQRLCRNATIWRQNVLQGRARPWARWDMNDGGLGRDQR